MGGLVQHLLVHGKARTRHVLVKRRPVAPIRVHHPNFRNPCGMGVDEARQRALVVALVQDVAAHNQVKKAADTVILCRRQHRQAIFAQRGSAP